MELGDGARAGVRERGLHAGDHVEQDGADALLSFADVDARRRDALAEEALLRALERVLVGRAVADRAELLDLAWGEADLEVSERAVDNVILRLRRKLPTPDLIETVRSVGFRIADRG